MTAEFIHNSSDRTSGQLTLHNGSFLKARNRPFLPLVLNKMDITSYLISIDVNSTLYDEVMHQFKIHLNVNIKFTSNVLSSTKTKSYTDLFIQLNFKLF